MKLRFWSALALTTVLFAGITPRSSVQDYPYRADAGGLELGAAFSDPAKTKKLFPMIRKNYIAIEIGLYPKAGESPEVKPDDFALQLADQPDSLVRRVEPWAAVEGSKPERAGPAMPRLPVNIDVYGGVGTGTGPGVYDPVTGRRGGGNGGGVIIGSGTGYPGRRPAESPSKVDTRDPDYQIRTMEVRELPEGRVAKPTSGYLFFPLPEGKNKRGYELIYYGEKRVILPMAVEKK